ncbi:MAG: tetratricopeptide repeat protein [Candidatus Sumerlaeia bacterium]|nr:tetratricopeptide repeat protein [Candidatus Sumerlaeia bacterium]
MFVTYVAIAKNEELVLERHLRSISGANKFWDHLLIADTGSTDRTRAIAESFGARVVDVPWTDSFCEARNAAASHAPPETDLIVTFDCDEELIENGHLLRPRLEEHFALGHFIMSVKFIWWRRSDGTPETVFARPSVYSPKHFRYENHFHNLLVGGPVPNPRVYFEDILLEHKPLKPRGSGKSELSLRLMKRQMADYPDSTRTLFYCGREFAYRREWEEAARLLERLLERGPAPEHLMHGAFHLGEALTALGRHDDARRAYLRVVEEMPNRREGWFWMLIWCYEAQRWREAACWGEAALAVPYHESMAAIMTDGRAFGPMPHDLLSVVYFNLGEKAKGRAHLEEAIRLAPGDQRLLDNRKWFE